LDLVAEKVCVNSFVLVSFLVLFFFPVPDAVTCTVKRAMTETEKLGSAASIPVSTLVIVGVPVQTETKIICNFAIPYRSEKCCNDIYSDFRQDLVTT